MLTLDLLLGPEVCAYCSSLQGRELVGRDSRGRVVCLVCSERAIRALSDERSGRLTAEAEACERWPLAAELECGTATAAVGAY